MVRAQGYGQNFKTYLDDANDEIVIIPQIDHIDAVREIEAIAAVSGFNAIFVDPYGISASMGMPGQPAHPEVAAAISRVQHFCEDAERRFGIFALDLETASRWLGDDFNLVAISSDAVMLAQRARDMLQVLR